MQKARIILCKAPAPLLLLGGGGGGEPQWATAAPCHGLMQESISVWRGEAPLVLYFCCFFHFFPSQPAQGVSENCRMLPQPSACPLGMGTRGQGMGLGCCLPAPAPTQRCLGQVTLPGMQSRKRKKKHKHDISQHPSTPPPRYQGIAPQQPAARCLSLVARPETPAQRAARLLQRSNPTESLHASHPRHLNYSRDLERPQQTLQTNKYTHEQGSRSAPRTLRAPRCPGWARQG